MATDLNQTRINLIAWALRELADAIEADQIPTDLVRSMLSGHVTPGAVMEQFAAVLDDDDDDDDDSEHRALTAAEALTFAPASSEKAKASREATPSETLKLARLVVGEPPKSWRADDEGDLTNRSTGHEIWIRGGVTRVHGEAAGHGVVDVDTEALRYRIALDITCQRINEREKAREAWIAERQAQREASPRERVRTPLVYKLEPCRTEKDIIGAIVKGKAYTDKTGTGFPIEVHPDLKESLEDILTRHLVNNEVWEIHADQTPIVVIVFPPAE